MTPEIYERFRVACGLVPMSRMLEEVLKDWLGKHSLPTVYEAMTESDIRLIQETREKLREEEIARARRREITSGTHKTKKE